METKAMSTPNTAVHAPDYGYGEPEKQPQEQASRTKELGVAKGMVRCMPTNPYQDAGHSVFEVRTVVFRRLTCWN